MVNLYELLGVSHTATEAEIKQAIAKHYADSTIQENILSKAKEWLLTPEIRSKYDAKLSAAYPELNQPKPTEPPVFNNLYEFLGVATDASIEDIQVAVDSLESQNADARQLNLCRNYLLNAERRKKYDKQQGILKPQPVRASIPKKSTTEQLQQPTQVVVKNTGCFGVAGGILLALAIIVIAPIVLLAMCTASAVSNYDDYKEKAKQTRAEQEAKTINAPIGQQKQVTSTATEKTKSIIGDYATLTKGGNGSASSPFIFTARDLSRIYSIEGANLQPMLNGTQAHIIGEKYESYTDRGTPEILLAGADGKPLVYAKTLSSEREDLKLYRLGAHVLLENCSFTGIENGYIKFQGCTVKAWSEYGE